MHTDITELLDMLSKSKHNYDFDMIKSAFEFAQICHEGQFRKSGEPYITHPIAVAELVASLDLDTSSICAALLHDTVEDCGDKATIEIIKDKFGSEVSELVDGLTKLVAIPFNDKEEEHIENLRKMFLAMSKDIRVIFIKLCDRLHNMRTLSSHYEYKQRTIALETMHVYAPLAHRLGMQKIKQELELLALQYLDPIGYDEVKKHIEEKYGKNKDFLDNAQNNIANKLNEQNIKFGIEGRVKSIYSIYKKMYNQNKSFEEIYDFYAIRIIVDTELECYTVLGIIHEMFNSMPGRFKDYISTPKPNMYRSLHTTVIGRDGIPFEVQIRTWEMHAVAEYGLAAHWKYKDGTNDDSLDNKLKWIRTILETEHESLDPDEVLRPLKIDIFEDETFVFTPKGDVINLPNGATGIDFAYAIHSAVGNKMVGLKINGMIAPIDTVLKTGQIVEVLTSASSKGPNRDWLKIVKTGEAKNKIRQWFKKEKRNENIALAANDFDRELNHYNKNLTDAEKDTILLNLAKRHGIQSADDFLNAIGYGAISISKISPRIKSEVDKITTSGIETPTPFANIQHESKKLANTKNTSAVIIEGLDNCQAKFAHCCNPLPGDNIIGFITKGYGISIHKYDCPNAVKGLQDPESKDRWVTASWSSSSAKSNTLYEADILILANNSISLLSDISMALSDLRVDILSMNSKSGKDGITTINLSVGAKSTEHFNNIISRLKNIKNVFEVTRGKS